MKITQIIKNLMLVSLLSVLVACGGGDGSDSVGGVVDTIKPAAMITGQVADGYLVGARVFLDRNANHMLDPEEPWTESENQGHYSLEVEPGEGNLFPVVAEIIAGQTIDEDLSSQYVVESYRLESPAGQWSFVSPLTTLVKNELDKDPSLSLQNAESRVRSQLGLSSNISLFADYILAQNNSGMENAHRAGRIIAGLMGRLQTEIELNVGAVNSASQQAAIALMINDQIMANGNTIAQSLISANDPNAIEEIKTTILSRINTPNLNTEILDRYIVQMQNTNSIWDMSPPKIMSHKPLVNGSASIDVTVSLRFDEEIAPASISADNLQIIGPSGPIAGTVAYDPTFKEISFTAESNLMAFTEYQVELSMIADVYGNTLEAPPAWSFTTIFDQVPPALPDF